MADATQVQIRRDTASILNTVTPALAELAYDSTNKTLRLGDGTTLGGTYMPNFQDIQNQDMISGTVGGGPNDITVTLPIPATSYGPYFTIRFLATATNTANMRVNVSGLGLKNIKKLQGTSLVDLVAGDVVLGGLYEITYDGVQFQLGGTGGGTVGVGQGDLKTSIGSGTLFNFNGATPLTSVTLGYSTAFGSSSPFASYIASLPSTGGGHVMVMLPGGQYGFYPNLGTSPSGASTNLEWQQRYVISSPPFDLGDGEVGGFFYAVVDSNGDLTQSYIAEVPPWAYNGPTDITATHKCKATGKKFRRSMKKRSFEDVMNGVPIKYEDVEITNKLKNADMVLIPHPFGKNIPAGHKVILLDPMDTKIANLIEYQNAGGQDVQEIIAAGKFQIDTDECKRCGPKGVKIHKVKYKFTKRV